MNHQPLPPFRIWICFLVSTVTFFAGNLARAGEVIFDMDSIQHQVGQITGKDQHKIPCGAAELVDGKFGKAVKFSFVEGASGGFMTGRVRPTADWEKSAGFSFWVKGDGSSSWGGIELIDSDDFGFAMVIAFPSIPTNGRKSLFPGAMSCRKWLRPS